MFEERDDKLGFSLKELAQQLPVSVPFLRKEIQRGKLKCKRFGDRVIILRDERDRYVFGNASGDDEQLER